VIDLWTVLMWFSGYVFLRYSALWMTYEGIGNGTAIEGNPLMRHFFEPRNKWGHIIYELFLGTVVLGIAIMTKSPAFMFIVLFILWIDFQHDWEVYCYSKMFLTKENGKGMRQGKSIKQISKEYAA